MHIKEKLQTFCNELKPHAQQAVETVESIEVVSCGYKHGHMPPESGWEPLNCLYGAHRHYWLRFSFHTPKAEAGSEYPHPERSLCWSAPPVSKAGTLTILKDFCT